MIHMGFLCLIAYQKKKISPLGIPQNSQFPGGGLGVKSRICLFISHGMESATPQNLLTSPYLLGTVQNSPFFVPRGFNC